MGLFPLLLPGYGLYILFSLPALLLGLWAQIKVKSAFQKYSQVRSYTSLTGAEVAKRMLNNTGLNDVKVEETGGFLSDNYDPRSRVLRLSPDVYGGTALPRRALPRMRQATRCSTRKGMLS